MSKQPEDINTDIVKNHMYPFLTDGSMGNMAFGITMDRKKYDKYILAEDESAKMAILSLFMMGCTQGEVSEMTGITIQTLTNETNGELFFRLEKSGKLRARTSLRAAMFRKAVVEGDKGMLIYLSKQPFSKGGLNMTDENMYAHDDEDMQKTANPFAEMNPKDIAELIEKSKKADSKKK